MTLEELIEAIKSNYKRYVCCFLMGLILPWCVMIISYYLGYFSAMR